MSDNNQPYKELSEMNNQEYNVYQRGYDCGINGYDTTVNGAKGLPHNLFMCWCQGRDDAKYLLKNY